MTIPFELEAELQAIALIYNTNERTFDKRAYEVVGRQIEGATARLAELIGKSVDWVEDRAKAYKLELDLKEEFGLASEASRNLPESFVVAVARKYSPSCEPDKLDLGEAFDKLATYLQPQPDGKPWTLDAVRADLPHKAKDEDYGKLIEKLAKSLPLFVKPTLLGISERQKKIALRIAGVMQQLSELVSEYREAK